MSIHATARTAAYLGVDVGTSSTKAVLVSPGGEVLGLRTRQHRVHRGPGGIAEMPMDVWWEDFRTLTAGLLSEQPVRVRAIGVSGMGPCVGVTDLDDVPLAPAALYGVDQRARGEIREMTERIGRDQLLAQRDSLLTTQAGGPKLAWFRARYPEAFEAGVRCWMPAGWIVRRLTGEYVLDRHSASQMTPLYDPATGQWDLEMLEATAPGAQLPRLGWSAQIAGHTRRLQDLPELAPGIPVIHGSIDAWAEQESVGAVEPGQLLLMYGTTLFLIANANQRVRHPAMWGTTGTRPGTHNLAGGLATSGALTDWLREITGESGYEALVAEAGAVPPGSGGLLSLPYFAGERTPIQDPDARGMLAGLTLSHTRGHLYRSLLEGTAFAVRHNIEVMETAGAHIGEVTCAGGGVASDLWPQIVSDVTGRAQLLRRDTVGAAYGDAFMAARAVGEAGELEEWNPVERVIEPRPTPVYDELYAAFRELYRVTADLQHRLAALQD